MIKNQDDIKEYIDTLDGQFCLDESYEHSFLYLCGEYATYPAICYMQKKDFKYKVQFVPIDRKIIYDTDEWIIFDDIGEFIWNNRYNICYSEIPYTDIMDNNNNHVADKSVSCTRGAGLEIDYKFTPNRKEMEYWEVVADQILQNLIDADALSKEYQTYNGTKGEAVSYCLYGICNGVILLQQNNSCKKRTYGEWHTKTKYYITDGQNIEEVSTPLRHLKKDDSIDGVVKHFARKLKNECLKHKILFNDDIEDMVAS